MSLHFSANQFEDKYAAVRLNNWEYANCFRKRPRTRKGSTKIISDARGHLIPDLKKAKTKNNAFGSFLNTFLMPRKITRKFCEEYQKCLLNYKCESRYSTNICTKKIKKAKKGDKKQMTPRKDDKKEKTPRKDDKKEMTPRKDDKKEKTPRKDDKKEMTPRKDDKKEKTPRKDDKKEVTTQKDEKKEMTPRKDDKKEMTPRKEDKKEMTPRKDDKKEMTPRKDDKKEITPRKDVKKTPSKHKKSVTCIDKCAAVRKLLETYKQSVKPIPCKSKQPFNSELLLLLKPETAVVTEKQCDKDKVNKKDEKDKKDEKPKRPKPDCMLKKPHM